MGFKPFLEGGIAAIIAGALTHPLDLIKVRMQLQGEHSFSLDQNPNPNLSLDHNLPVKPYRPVFALDSLIGSISLLPLHIHAPSSSTRSVMTPFAVGAHIVKTEGPAALFSGVSATILRQMLYSATRMGIYDFLKRRWTDQLTGNNTKLDRQQYYSKNNFGFYSVWFGLITLKVVYSSRLLVLNKKTNGFINKCWFGFDLKQFRFVWFEFFPYYYTKDQIN